jgi:hypothetical protein
MGQGPSGQACRRERKEYEDGDGQKLEALRQDMEAKKRNLEACETPRSHSTLQRRLGKQNTVVLMPKKT